MLIPVVRAKKLRFVIRHARTSAKVPKIRAQCGHTVHRRESVWCGDVLITERTHWKVGTKPQRPVFCLACSPWGRHLKNALLCALDRHVIFPDTSVATCDGADPAFVPYATTVDGKPEQFICCTACAGSARRRIGIWNGTTISP